MRFVNLTPHTINLNSGESYPSEGICRVSSEHSDFDKNNTCTIKYGTIEGLPEPQDDVLYIVSAIVFQATDRRDVVCPASGHPNVIRREGQIASIPGFLKK